MKIVRYNDHYTNEIQFGVIFEDKICKLDR